MEELSRRYVGIDLHRIRSVVVTMDETGEVLKTKRIVNHAQELLAAVPPGAEVALEATYGWYWAGDLLAAHGANVHLVHPLGLHWDKRRVKNDVKDATELANRLRYRDLPEAWKAPPELRELRELVRYRAKLAGFRTSLKAQTHAVMAKEGFLPPKGEMFGPTGQALLDAMPFGEVYRRRVESLRKLLVVVEAEIGVLEAELARRLKDHDGYRAIQAINGVGPIFAAVFVAEIGDATRFPSARHLCSWAGMTPSHKESDTKVRRGAITKQGSNLVRWAAVEAVARYHGGAAIDPAYRRIAERRGPMIARVAAARKLLTLVYYGLRDGHVRCLAQKDAA